MIDDKDFDGCHSECRRKGEHSRIWGGCEFGIKPEPTVNMSVVYRDTDGQNSIGYDSYTVDQLAELIEPALQRVRLRLGPNASAAVARGEAISLSGGEMWHVGREVAHAIIHRNDADRTPPPQPSLITRVLEIFSLSHADAYGDLFWRVDDGLVSLFANVSDVFAWGGSDCEPITRETLPELERAYSDLKTVGAEGFTAELYTARRRHTRPQGAAYPDKTDPVGPAVAALYNACGPERETGLGNPRKPPVYPEGT